MERNNMDMEFGMASGERNQVAVIGPSIYIKGEVSGSEDLLIQGSVEGTVSLPDNTVIIGCGADVKANVQGKIIRVEGKVVGDLHGCEMVVVHASGNVHGNITAPRLSLEDGARLRGAIDTDPESTQQTMRAQLTKTTERRLQPELVATPVAPTFEKVNGTAKPL